MGANISAIAGSQRLRKSFLTHSSEHLTIQFVTSVDDNQEYLTVLHDSKKEHSEYCSVSWVSEIRNRIRMYFEGKWIGILARRNYETYISGKKDLVSQAFCKHQVTWKPSQEKYSHFDILSGRMGVTSHLQCNWRLSACNEGVDS